MHPMKYLARKMTPLLMGALLSAPALFSTTLFLENFDNNDNGWTNTGVGYTFGSDPGGSGQNVAYASTADNGSANARLTLPDPVSIIDEEALMLDFSVRVDKIAPSSSHNRFSVQLAEADSNQSITFDIRPASEASRIYCRNSAGNDWVYEYGSNYTYPNTSEFVHFRLTLIDNGNSTLAAEGFKRDSNDSDWVSIYDNADPSEPTISTVTYENGNFDEISIYSHNNNGSTDNRVYFDYGDQFLSIAVPESGNFALIVGVLGDVFCIVAPPSRISLNPFRDKTFFQASNSLIAPGAFWPSSFT